jgi:hypothetical protein
MFDTVPSKHLPSGSRQAARETLPCAVAQSHFCTGGALGVVGRWEGHPGQGRRQSLPGSGVIRHRQQRSPVRDQADVTIAQNGAVVTGSTLVAGNGDLDVAPRVIGESGGSWNVATIAYGKREFVE